MVEVPTQRVTLARALLITLVSGVAVAAPRLVQLAARFGPSPLTVRLDAGVADSESTVVVLASNYCFCNRAMSIADPLSSSFVAVRRTEPGFPSSTQTWVLNQPRAGTREVTVSTSTTSDMAVVVLEYRGLAANSVADSGATVTASTSQVTTPTLVVEDGGLVLGFAWDQTSFGVPDAWTVEGLDGSAQKLTVFGSASAGCTMVVAHALAPPSRERFTFRRNDGVSSGGLHGSMACCSRCAPGPKPPEPMVGSRATPAPTTSMEARPTAASPSPLAPGTTESAATRTRHACTGSPRSSSLG